MNSASPDSAPDDPDFDGVDPSNDAGDPLAPISKRIGARFIDWAFLMTVWLLLGAATSERLEDDTLVFQRWAVVVWMVLVIVYEVAFVAWRGQTPGKRLLGIQLVSLKNGRILSVPAAVTRVLPVAFSIAVLGTFFPIVMVFVYFSAAFMKHRRGVLDHLAGSVVIEAR